MPQENIVLLSPTNELDEELNINLKKMWKIVWSRKELIIKVFSSVLLFFILLTLILPKKYIVSSDLYIDKTNDSNMMEINPYVLGDANGTVVSMGVDKAINNEIELMKSELVLDKVIKDNDIRYKKGKKKGEYLTAEAFYDKGKKLKIENIKNTNVITIKFKANNPELAYGVVSSLIANYIELHKELNSEKSKADKDLIASEYAKAKESLNMKLNQSSGLPVQTMSNIGNLSAMSAFSKSASLAVGNLKNQYLEGQKSNIAITEESQKLAQLAAKLEWAKMVEQMSDSSKVLVLKEPKQLRPFEKTSPKLLVNIILGCVFGFIASLIALFYVEAKDEKLTYSALSNNILYDGINNFNKIVTEVFGYSPKKVLLVSLVQLPQEFSNKIQTISNADVIYPDLTDKFIENVSTHDEIMFVSKIQVTKTDTYKNIQNIVNKQNKTIACDILI